jgi:hypothetical protein
VRREEKSEKGCSDLGFGEPSTISGLQCRLEALFDIPGEDQGRALGAPGGEIGSGQDEFIKGLKKD